MPAGKFESDHVKIVRPGQDRPIEIWATGEHMTFVQIRFPHLGQIYQLVELVDSGSD